MTQWIDAGPADEAIEDQVLAATVGGRDVAVFRIGNEIFALLDRCSHGAAKLSDGYVEDGCVECPLHQGLIDIRTGEPRSAPIVEPVKCLPARIREGRIEIEV